MKILISSAIRSNWVILCVIVLLSDKTLSFYFSFCKLRNDQIKLRTKLILAKHKARSCYFILSRSHNTNRNSGLYLSSDGQKL